LFVFIGLMMMAVLFAAGNAWFAAARSTIPLSLDAVVKAKEARHEKHPPRDDVYLLALGESQSIQVDQSVFDQIEDGDRLLKDRGSRTLRCDDHTVALEWSHDARGLFYAMPLVVLMMMAISVWAARLRS
jgi:hypothetical protein